MRRFEDKRLIIIVAGSARRVRKAVASHFAASEDAGFGHAVDILIDGRQLAE